MVEDAERVFWGQEDADPSPRPSGGGDPRRVRLQSGWKAGGVLGKAREVGRPRRQAEWWPMEPSDPCGRVFVEGRPEAASQVLGCQCLG